MEPHSVSPNTPASLRLTAGLALVGLWSLGCASVAGTGAAVETREVHPAVRHIRMVREEGPWVINVLEVNLNDSSVVVGSVRAREHVRERETTSSMARRSQDSLWTVLGAVNADFFESDGESVSHQIADGLIVQAVARPLVRSQFAVTRGGRCLIEEFDYSGRAIFPAGEVLPISAVNKWKRTRGLIAFNRYAMPAERVDTPAAAVREVRLRNVLTRADTLLYVPGDLSRDGEFLVLRWLADSLNVPTVTLADTVRVLHRFLPDRGPLSVLVGGLPRLVIDGGSVADREELREGSSGEFATRRHPRSGVGFSRDSTMLYLVAVDGRQQASLGMTLAEFAGLMISLGIYQGLNLDGGGSTTMVVGDSVVNSPSDLTGERPVSNALLIRARRHGQEHELP